MSDRPLSVRSRARRRDYHGRGMRGPTLPRTLPAWKTRSETFDALLAGELAFYRRLYPEKLDSIDYGVLEVPESEPAPWETSAPLSRFIPASHHGGDGGRVIFYRRPIIHSARGENLAEFIHTIVVEQLAAILDCDPQSIPDRHS
ncbi:MAG: metallopeptidase family protein [Actinomycetaceae bacterium]|nr:metallopeptidase family protein [Actinomycetaceae bacterium]